jgi:pre-mRNA-splicing factor CWC22
MSSVDFEECAHKLLKLSMREGQEIELCNMITDCCMQERTYMRFFGLLAQRFSLLNEVYRQRFQESFYKQFATIHRLDTNKLRNIAKFYAHLLYTDAIEWKVFECIKLTEDDTTASSRIFIKIVFQELCELMGLEALHKKLLDETLLEYFAGLFPKDNLKNTRFSINFFTSIGLGALTVEMRDFLQSAPKLLLQQQLAALEREVLESGESSNSESEGSSVSESESDSESKSKPQHKTELRPQSKQQPKIQPKPESKPQTKSQQPESKPKFQPKSESKPQTKSQQIESQPKIQPKPESKPQTKSQQPESQPKLQPKKEVKKIPAVVPDLSSSEDSGFFSDAKEEHSEPRHHGHEHRHSHSKSHSKPSHSRSRSRSRHKH